MLCILNNHTDPYFNIAIEEYILKNFEEDCFMLWRSTPSIVVGKHQNTLAEINMEWVRDNDIKVVRRLSGGGTVFHDLGNLNFTFIVTGEEGNLVHFRKFTNPIIEVLATLGIEARFEGRNNLTINGLKFSGNAEHVFRKRTLHHGTLLFSSEMADLSNALKVNLHAFTDKAVKSVRSAVTNISDHLKQPMAIEEFRDRIMAYIMAQHSGSRLYTFSDDDIRAIEVLCNEKYRTWEWNFGYSPRYTFEKQATIEGHHATIFIQASEGVIREARIKSTLLERHHLNSIEKSLVGVQHEPNAIEKCLSMALPPNSLQQSAIKALATAMF